MNAQISEKQIRLCMVEANIGSISELSRATGISRTKLYKLMREESPYQPALLKVAAALGVEAEQLLQPDETEGQE